MPKAEDESATLKPLTAADLDTEINHEPRIQDLRLAEILGFKDRRKIRELIDRHRDALESFGVISRHVARNSRRGRPTDCYYLNKRQALYITAKSDTERAALVTIQMVEVFDAVMSGRAAETAAQALTDNERELLETYRRLSSGSGQGGGGGKAPPPPGAPPPALPPSKGFGRAPEPLHPLRALVVVFRHPPGNVTAAAADAWFEAADRLEWTLDGCGIPPLVPRLRPLTHVLAQHSQH